MTSDTHLQALTQVLCRLQEKQRRALSGAVRDHADKAWLGQQPQNAIAVAVLGCVTGVRQVAAKVEWLHLEAHAEPLAVQVLRHRNPTWLTCRPRCSSARSGSLAARASCGPSCVRGSCHDRSFPSTPSPSRAD